MNFIEVTTIEGNRVLINIKYISDVLEVGEQCEIYSKEPEVSYSIKESYEEIKMKLLRFAGIG